MGSTPQELTRPDWARQRPSMETSQNHTSRDIGPEVDVLHLIPVFISPSPPFQMHVQSCFASTILFPLCSFHPAKSRIVHITSLIYHEAMLIIFLVELECSQLSPPPHNAYVLCSFSCTTGLSCCRKPLKSGIICRNPDMICLSVSRL